MLSSGAWLCKVDFTDTVEGQKIDKLMTVNYVEKQFQKVITDRFCQEN